MRELTKSQIELALLEWFKYDVAVDQHDFYERMERAITAAFGTAPAARECRHCGWMCMPNSQPGQPHYPLSSPVVDGGRAFPAELTPAVRRILGMMLWETTPIAGALRAAGRQINRKVEDEQAVALHWLLGFALEHGMEWEKPAAAALLKMTQAKKD